MNYFLGESAPPLRARHLHFILGEESPNNPSSGILRLRNLNNTGNSKQTQMTKIQIPKRGNFIGLNRFCAKQKRYIIMRTK